MSRAEISKDELDVAWFSRKELVEIKNSCEELAQSLCSGHNNDILKGSDSHCDSRGLEPHLQKSKRKEVRALVAAAVFHRQMTNAKASKIAKSARKQSESSVAEAILRAKDDEREAMKSPLLLRRSVSS